MEDEKEYYALIGSNRGIIDWYSFVQKIYNNGECSHKEMIDGRTPFVLITKEEIEKVDGVKQSNLYKDLLNDKNHKCDHCGCRSNYFMQDYRTQSGVTSKVWNCEFCHILNDETYNKLGNGEMTILQCI